MHVSDKNLTGAYITEDPSTWPSSSKLWEICKAVAHAEGYNLGRGTAPFDLNNPGDLSPGDEAGQPTSGVSEPHDGSRIIHFATAEGGWRALYHKFDNIVAGKSQVYPKSWTWQQISTRYAGNSENWLKSVTLYLKVDPSSTPAQYLTR